MPHEPSFVVPAGGQSGYRLVATPPRHPGRQNPGRWLPLDAQPGHVQAATFLSPVGGAHITDPVVTESIEEALDYLAALSLAWLHTRRRADAGNPVRTAGFPVPPDARPTWRGVVVPAVVVKNVDAVREALGQPPPQGNEDVDLFDGSVPVDRSPTKPRELRSTADHVLVDHAIVRVRDTDGDVFASVTIQPGEEFEITATGTITAPEFLTQPSDANGWYVVDDARFALHSGLDPVNAHKYALLGRLGGYFFCGTHRPRQRFLYHRSLPLYLRVNNDDSRLGAGQGGFVVTVDVFGPRRLGAQFMYAEIPATMGAGVASDMTLHFRNLGSPWEPFADVRLVLDPARSDPAWPVREMRLTMRVPPREVGTFYAGVPAPARQGTYRLAWVLMAGDVRIATSDEWHGRRSFCREAAPKVTSRWGCCTTCIRRGSGRTSCARPRSGQ